MRKKKTVRRRSQKKREIGKKSDLQMKEYLKDTPPDKCFWVNNGWIIRNLEELPIALDNMSDDTFNYHVNKDKNDFSKWVRDVIGDETLAGSLEGVKNREDAIKIVNKRIKQLKR